MRGFTSHARHRYEMGKDELIEAQKDNNANKSRDWKILGGIGALLVALLTLGELDRKFQIKKLSK